MWSYDWVSREGNHERRRNATEGNQEVQGEEIPRAKDGAGPTDEIGSTGSIMLSSFMLGQNVCTTGWDD